MNLIDFTKQLLNKLIKIRLSYKHRNACLGLVLTLLILLLLPNSESIAPESQNPNQNLVLDNSAFSTSTFDPLNTATELNSVYEIEATIETVEANVGIQQSLENDSITIAEVRSGDNLSLIFDRVGLSPQDVYRVSNSAGDASILTRLYPGYSLDFDIDSEGELNELEVIINPLESYVFELNSAYNFDITHVLRDPQLIPIYKEATINDSLFLAAQRGGISAAITMEIAGIFGGVVDFMLDTRVGDNFNVFYDERHLDGEYIGNGSIQVAQYTNQGENFTAIRYVNLNGEVDYYNPLGESMRKAFIRNPVDFTRISSNFTLSRRHPILNTIRAHKGTDYAAPTGTPVVASGDGRVTWASRNGSFGNLVVVKHGERFETKYAHLSSYARGVRVGSRVKQGDTIGYVGSTGGATGPHLHYEFIMDGAHRNPRTVHDQLPKAESVPAEEMDRFNQQSQILMTQLNSITSAPTLAQNTLSTTTLSASTGE
ncbi:MAG: peptidoglycan DD-metalloendopeptidase family protein [Gammaproteobacteria bacterium]|jgi:murein DD-endopeptidase MepM/ murein hydrolase activator NlpD|nr:peptidoglycan DD-metalloendopeptidase family protein [Gammaproteobacteria bacterium]